MKHKSLIETDTWLRHCSIPGSEEIHTREGTYNNGPSLGIYIHDLLIGIYTTSFPNSVLFPTTSGMNRASPRLLSYGFLSVGTTDEIDAMIQWLSFIHEFGRWQ